MSYVPLGTCGAGQRLLLGSVSHRRVIEDVTSGVSCMITKTNSTKVRGIARSL